MNGYESFFSNAKNTVKGWFGLSGDNKKQTSAVARQSIGATALQYYEGSAPMQLAVKQNQPDDNVYVNYAETIVDKGVDFLFGKPIKISIGTDEDRSGEKYFDSVWAPRTRALDLIEMATDAAIFGDAYLKIRIGGDGKPTVEPLDPSLITVECDPKNYRQVLKYICAFDSVDASGETVRFKEETARENNQWTIREFQSKNGSEWIQIGKDVFWNYSFAPIFHCKNLPKSQSFYGKPDLSKSVLILVKYLSRLDSLTGKIVRVHSSPKPYAVGLERQDLQIGTEDMLFLPELEQKIGLLEMKGDLVGALAFRKQMREALAEISKCPEISTGKTESIGQLSGFALQILYGPLIGQTEKKQLLFGELIESAVAALLEIGNHKSLVDKIQLHWPSPIPIDPHRDAETALIRLSAGFSQDTEVRRLGGDPHREREMKKLEADRLATALGQALNAGASGAELYG